MQRNTIPAFGLCSALLFIACSPNRDRDQPSAARTDATATAEKPPPFDKGPVKIALVQYSGAGDYFEQWTKGAEEQADAVGFTMQRYDAKADDARQAADMKSAIERGRRRRHRTLALQLAGQLGSKQVVFPGVLVTQAFLLKEQVKNMDDLRAKLPDLNLANVASAAWIRSVTF